MDLMFGVVAIGGLLLSFAVQVAVVLVALVALVALVLWDAKMRGRGATFARDRPAPSPLAILEERYARGEIDAAELQERRNVLRGDHT